MVYAVALSLVQSADADDVAQDAFLRAFRNLDLLADPAKFGVWLRRITFCGSSRQAIGRW
jgi:RNA polymerase sigma-70 factor, ECF subfamily